MYIIDYVGENKQRQKMKKWISNKLFLKQQTYHICNLIFFPSRSIVRILKSIPENQRVFLLTKFCVCFSVLIELYN